MQIQPLTGASAPTPTLFDAVVDQAAGLERGAQSLLSSAAAAPMDSSGLLRMQRELGDQVNRVSLWATVTHQLTQALRTLLGGAG